MAKPIYISDDETPPNGERSLLIQWVNGSSPDTHTSSSGVIKYVPEALWPAWEAEAPKLAKRLGLSKVYFRGRPEHRGACADTDATA